MKNRGGIVAGFVILLIVWGGYRIFYAQSVHRLGELRRQLKAAQVEMHLLKPSHVRVSSSSESSGAPSVRPPMTEKDIPFVLETFFSQITNGTDIRFKLINPGAVQPEGAYRRLPLNLMFDGTFSDVTILMDRVEHLPMVARTDSLEVRRLSDRGDVSCRLQVSLLLLPGGPAVMRSRITGPGGTPPLVAVPDPFVNAGERESARAGAKLSASSEPVLRLSGVWIGKTPRAVINDRVVTVGMTIEGYRVVRIGVDRVLVSKSGTQKILKVGRRE